MTTTILGLGGSLRPNSTATLAMHVALAGAQETGAQITLIDLAMLRLPLFDGTYELDGYRPDEIEAITTLLTMAEEAQGLILVSPTYHNTISGALKNALDLLEIDREHGRSRLAGKAVGLVSVQGGTSGTGNNTITTMLLATRAMGAWVVPTMVSIPGSREAFDETGQPKNPAIKKRLLSLGTEVARASVMLANHWVVG
jgi:FMN reductase